MAPQSIRWQMTPSLSMMPSRFAINKARYVLAFLIHRDRATLALLYSSSPLLLPPKTFLPPPPSIYHHLICSNIVTVISANGTCSELSQQQQLTPSHTLHCTSLAASNRSLFFLFPDLINLLKTQRGTCQLFSTSPAGGLF